MKIKKFISELIATAVLFCGVIPGLYPEVGKIVQLDEENDIVYVANCSGHVFSFYGIEDLNMGDLIGMIMDDNGTPLIYDDKVVDIIYGGRPEDFCDCEKTEETEEDTIMEEIFFEFIEIEEEEVYLEELPKEYLLPLFPVEELEEIDW